MSDPGPVAKERIRAALDILENYLDKDGRLDATAITTDLREMRARIAGLESQISAIHSLLEVRSERIAELETEVSRLKSVIEALEQEAEPGVYGPSDPEFWGER